MGPGQVIAIVPARGGSKGVPGKNVRALGGYPLMAYSIAVAHQCSEIDRVLVSTDSEEIAAIARAYGAEVPFLRPPEFARDLSPDIEFILHALDRLESGDGGIPELLVQLRPTTPLRLPERVDEAIRAIKSHSQATSLRSVHELPEPPQKMFGIQDGYLVGLFPQDPRTEYYNLPRQTFPPAYHPNGYVDVLRSSYVRESGTLHGPRMQAYVTPVSVEIDRIEDLEYLTYLIETQGHPLQSYLRSNFPVYHHGTL